MCRQQHFRSLRHLVALLQTDTDFNDSFRLLKIRFMAGHRDIPLQAYYQYNRRMQLNNDLSAQNTFLQQYKGYLAQLVGYFVIEERVRRVSHALSGGEVNTAISHCHASSQNRPSFLPYATKATANAGKKVLRQFSVTNHPRMSFSPNLQHRNPV